MKTKKIISTVLALCCLLGVFQVGLMTCFATDVKFGKTYTDTVYNWSDVKYDFVLDKPKTVRVTITSTNGKYIFGSLCNEYTSVYYGNYRTNREKIQDFETYSTAVFVVSLEANDQSAGYIADDVFIGSDHYTILVFGHYDETPEITFKIEDITPKITLSSEKFSYNGKVQKPTVTLKDRNGNALKKDKDYKLTYSNSESKEIGKYSVKISFKGSYKGAKSITKEYTIGPAKVKNLKATTVAKDSIALSWSKATGAKYYKVQQSTDGKKWTTVKTVDKTSYTVSSLKKATKYQFRVLSLDSKKKVSGIASDVLKVCTLTSAPTIKLKSTKSKTVTVSWEKVTGAKKYIIYTSPDGKKWSKVGTTENTSYTLTKLSGGKKINVRVKAANAYNYFSEASKTQSITVKK